jgi:hypothetical protein
MTRQYFVPGWGYVNEAGTQQYLIPGQGYINEGGAISGQILFALITNWW